MLSAKLYEMANGPRLLVTGDLVAGGWRWNVSAFLKQPHRDGPWRLSGSIYRMGCYIDPRHGPDREASRPERQALLKQIYAWVDETYPPKHAPGRLEFEPTGQPSKETSTMPEEKQQEGKLNCTIITMAGTRCGKTVEPGQQACIRCLGRVKQYGDRSWPVFSGQLPSVGWPDLKQNPVPKPSILARAKYAKLLGFVEKVAEKVAEAITPTPEPAFGLGRSTPSALTPQDSQSVPQDPAQAAPTPIPTEKQAKRKHDKEKK